MSPLRSTLHLGCVEEPDAAEAAGQARCCCSRTAAPPSALHAPPAPAPAPYSAIPPRRAPTLII